jgi:hypothetical protein
VPFAVRFLVLLTGVALVACSPEPVPVAERFATAEDAPGTKPDPVETRQTIDDLDEFITAYSEALIDPDRDEMSTVLEDAGFTRGGMDARFYGETHATDAPHVFSSFIELDSEDGARSTLDWLDAESRKPCPRSCATKISTFDVDDIPDALSVHRIATEEDIEAAGFEGEIPSASYWVGFTLGSIVYTVELQGEPGSVSEGEALEIANAYYERLNGD